MFPDLKQHRDRNPSPLPGTCTWLFEHHLYNNWLKSNDSFLLWVSADPGCGKSVIASHLINTRLGFPKDQKTDLFYFLFKADYPDQRSALNAIQALIIQLTNRYPHLKAVAAEILNGRNPDSINNLWDVFIQTALRRRGPDDASAQCTFCILDGLDECVVDDRRTFARLISETFGQVSSPTSKNVTLNTASKMTSIKMLILSRPDNAIKVAFDKPIPFTNSAHTRKYRAAMIRLRGEDETKAISADVGRVIDAQLKTMIEQGLPHDLLKDVQVQLVKRADRTFLWVALILPLLAKKVESGVSRRELASILDNRDIDKLYEELLAMSPEVGKARKALQILLAAVKPLTLAQMSIAVAISPDHDIIGSSNGPPLRPGSSTMQDLRDNLHYPFETHLKHICGNFIQIIQDKVYLVHETAREFLLDKSSLEHHVSYPQNLTSMAGETRTMPHLESGNPTNLNVGVPSTHSNDLWRHSFTLVESSALMLQICTTFLYMMGKEINPEVPGESSEAIFHEFLGYVSKSWFRHFGDVREIISPKDLRYYENLCHPKCPAFAAWTEAFLGTYTMTAISRGRSWDQIQDYLVDMLSIVLIFASDNLENISEDEISECEDDDFDDLLSTRALEMAMTDESAARLSSNPASQNNSHFPLQVDANGFVALDFNAAGKKII